MPMPATAPVTEFELALPAARLTGRRWGRPGATPVLAIHGWLDNAASFDRLAPLLVAGLDWDLLAIDLPGHGHSSWLANGYSQAQHAAALLGLLDALDWQRVTLLGHSLGASIATLLAASLPERVQQLVCIDALGPLSAPPAQTASRLRDYLLAVQPGQRRPPRPLPSPAHAVRARVQANGLSPANAQALVERGLRQDGDHWVWRTDPALTLPSAVYLDEAQVQALLAAVRCPSLLLQADSPGRFIAPELQQQRQACLPGLQTVRLGGGHHLHMENAEAAASAIRAFVNKAESKA